MVMSVLLMVAVALASSSAPAEARGHGKSPKQAVSEIVYVFTGHLGITDDEGRRLIWEGTITGDINGTMKWWFGPSPATGGPFLGGTVSYYAGRWEIWDQEGKKLLLAGESAGKTVFPVTAEGERLDGVWDGHGVVTEARKDFRRLKGRRIYETGPVVMDPFPYSGTGMFSIY
jgi:hypothetical protein